MITIENLEVQFDVEGDGDEQVFISLFNRYIQEWARLQKEEEKVTSEIYKDRMLGDESYRGSE